MHNIKRSLWTIRWIGTASALLGALLVASNTGYSKYGFLSFLLSTFCWSYAAHRVKDWAQMMMQFGFMGVNLFGIWRWLL